MKKLTAIFAMALMLPMSLLFVSCDEDAEVAYHLDGAWRGNMYVKTAYGGRTYTATYSEIEFYSGYNSGTGVWVDYYSGAPYDYVANHISLSGACLRSEMVLAARPSRMENLRTSQ